MTLAIVGATILAASTTAHGQFLPRPSGTPPTPGGAPLAGGIGAPPAAGGFSPYLNLLRGSNSAAVNYFGIVRPQFNFRSSLQAVQQQQAQMQATMSEPDDPTMPGLVVGTPVRFLNTGGYFLNLNGSGQGTTAAQRGGRSPGAMTPAAGPVGGSGFASGIGAFSGGLLGSSSGNRGGARIPR